jgi:hypothetical protein
VLPLSAVLLVLCSRNNPQVGKPVVRSISVYVIDLPVWPPAASHKDGKAVGKVVLSQHTNLNVSDCVD